MQLRTPAVAGSFYNEDATILRHQVEGMLSGEANDSGPAPLALVVPHAGFYYSGQVAADAYRLLSPYTDQFKRVVITCPNHRVPLQGMAVPCFDGFVTPLGVVSVDRDGCQALSGLPNVAENNHPHDTEHGIEVQLPFLQQLFGDGVSLIPIVVGDALTEQVSALYQQLLSRQDTLLIVSSDLSHFLHYEDAVRRDSVTIEHILRREPVLAGADACGFNALNGLLMLANQAGYRLESVSSCNSGDVSGEWSRVVGYASFAVYPV